MLRTMTLLGHLLGSFICFLLSDGSICGPMNGAEVSKTFMESQNISNKKPAP
jgi:hypothetical protein